MTPIIIGTLSAVLVIFIVTGLRRLDKPTMYGLILSGIGFLYVGFTWADMGSLIINSVQALCFLFIAFYGIKKSVYFLVAGYFLHGLWDLAYNFFRLPKLIPPHYDLFCSSLDFTIGVYLMVIAYRNLKSRAFHIGG